MVEVQPRDTQRAQRVRKVGELARQREVRRIGPAVQPQPHDVAAGRLDEDDADVGREQRREVVDVPAHATAPAVDDEGDRRPRRRREPGERGARHRLTSA